MVDKLVAGMNSPTNDRNTVLLSRRMLKNLVPDESLLDDEEDLREPQSNVDIRIDRFRDSLDAETFVNISKLRRDSKHGIPNELRAEVWKYILGVLRPEKSDELSLLQRMQSEYSERVTQIHDDDEVARRVRGEVRRIGLRDANRTQFVGEEEKAKAKIDVHLYVRIISIYLSTSSNAISYHPAMAPMFLFRILLNMMLLKIPLVSPFVHVERIESDAYYCFQALMKRHEEIFRPGGLNQAVANFLTLLRVLEPELTEYLENEEVEPNSWVPLWLQTLLSGQLPMHCVLRLWDTYFSSAEGLDLHTYVCLAVINWLREELLEQDGPDISSSLLNLPMLNMDQIVARAYNIREDVLGRKLL